MGEDGSGGRGQRAGNGLMREYCYIAPEEAKSIERILWAVFVLIWAVIGGAGFAIVAFAIDLALA